MKNFCNFIVLAITIPGEILVFLSMLAFAVVAILLLIDGIWQPVVVGAIFLAGAPGLIRFFNKPWSMFAMRSFDEESYCVRSKPLFFFFEALPVIIMSSWAAFNYYLFIDMTSVENYWKFAIFSCFLAINPIRKCLNPYNMIENLYARYMTASFIFAYILAYVNVYTNYFSLANSITILYVSPLLCYIIWVAPKVFLNPGNIPSNEE